MLKEIKIGDTLLLVDAAATANYRTPYNEPCDCAACRNYFHAVESRKSLLSFLKKFGIDAGRPEEIAWWGEDVASKTLEYHVWYSVCGEMKGADISRKLPDAMIEITRPGKEDVFPNTGRGDPYFWISFTVRLPWVSNEDMGELFKPAPRSTLWQKIKTMFSIRAK